MARLLSIKKQKEKKFSEKGQIQTRQLKRDLKRRVKDISHSTRHCNICGEKFRSRNRFVRYCSKCKNTSELLQFSEWLEGNAPEEIAMSIREVQLKNHLFKIVS